MCSDANYPVSSMALLAFLEKNIDSIKRNILIIKREAQFIHAIEPFVYFITVFAHFDNFLFRNLSCLPKLKPSIGILYFEKCLCTLLRLINGIYI
jgi:hypothetical protein